MPQSIDKYKILVASPSDVLDERESIDEVIIELNRTYGTRANLILELIKWETHTAPAASETDVQDLIDKDLGSDYDLFIGILWKEFGTPTDKYNSGTEQEFRNAHQRFKQDTKSLQILFYFKNSTPLSLSEIDPLQLKEVNKFKSELGNNGIYYWNYNTIEELQRFLRIHIPMRIDELRKSNSNSELKNIRIETPVIEEVPNEDSREKDSALWIKSPMECCGKMADTIPNWGILTNLKREPQPSSMQFSIHIVPDISECSRQTNLVYQESLVSISHPPLKIFKEVNSYII
ncbi:MAG: hypothetical protein IIC75_04100 [Bacteroidetes bacterium]|nr:hypothetical protein [Bacteroidota bacterium]